MAANTRVSRFGQRPTKYEEQAPRAKRQEIYGLTFPLGNNRNSGGFFKKNSGRALIKQAVTQLIRTERGERLMLPNYGCNLRKYLFQPVTQDLFGSIRNTIEESFRNYIVGARLLKVGVFETGEYDAAGGNQLRVVLSIQLTSDDLEIFDVEAKIK
jgi:phage baseplate assembly protein W